MAQSGRKAAGKAKADVGGTWAGNVFIDYSKADQPSDPADSAPKRIYHTWMMIWPKSHLWWYQYTSSVSNYQVSVGGRWRMSGDTLWLGENQSYTKSKLQLTNIVYRRAMTTEPGHDSAGNPINMGKFLPGILDSVDTLNWKRYPINDSLFWSSDTTSKEATDRTKVSAYKVSVSNGRMTLVRLDSVSYKTADLEGDESLLVKSKKLVLRRATAPISWPELPPGWP